MLEQPVADRFAERETFECPFEYYQALRTSAPVFYSNTLKSFVVSRDSDARAVLEDPEVFSSAVPDSQTSVMARYSAKYRQLYEDAGTATPLATLVAIDGDAHREYRRLVDPFFRPAAIRSIETSILEIVNGLIDGFIDRGTVDLYGEFCLKVPVFVICDVLGIPREAAPLMKSAADASMDLVGAGILSETEKVAAHMRVIELNKYLQPFIDTARRESRPGVIGHLANARFEDRPLSDREIIAFAQTLNLGGNETTTNGLGNSFYLLLTQPGCMSALRGDAELIPKFVEEALRLESPINAAIRWAKQDVQVAGVNIPAGSCVHVRLPSANRDSTRHRNPAEIELSRPMSRNHLSFGSGVHHCLGAGLARTELKISLERVLQRIEYMELAVDASCLEHQRKTQIRGFVSLPVRLHRTRASID